jgi:hypothetical protein
MELDTTDLVSTWSLVDTIRSQPAAITPRSRLIRPRTRIGVSLSNNLTAPFLQRCCLN